MSCRPFRFLTWFGKLAKRLLFRRGFIALLLLIPALGALMSVAAKEDSGITTVLVVVEDENDKTACGIADALLEDDSVIFFKKVDDADEAIETVALGKADAAWVIPKGLDETLTLYAGDISKDVTLAKVYQFEETPIQRLVREKLNGVIFPFLSQKMYKAFGDKIEGAGIPIDSAEYERYYEEAAFKTSIVEYTYLGSAASADNETAYLTSPVRGIASLAAFLCTLAATLYSMQDEKSGFFLRIPLGKRLPLIFASNLSAALISSVMLTAALIFCGSYTSPLPETAAALAFALASAALCTLLCRVFSSPFALGAAIPPIILASAVICPIFISIRLSAQPDLLFPVTYALRAYRIPRYLSYAVIYSALCLAAAAALDRIRRKRA